MGNMSERNLEELLRLGVRYVGEFSLKGDRLRFFLNNYKDDAESYAFVVGQTVKPEWNSARDVSKMRIY
jgi:hypothetical protein